MLTTPMLKEWFAHPVTKLVVLGVVVVWGTLWLQSRAFEAGARMLGLKEGEPS